MASNIDPTQPPEGLATTQKVRDNFAAAKAEIEQLQTDVGTVAAAAATAQAAADAAQAQNDSTLAVLVEVRNVTGATLPKGSIVYITGAVGQFAVVEKARADAEATSAKTLGWIHEDIANNANGHCQISGYLSGIDTAGHTEGAALWLSPTVAGDFQETKPDAPNHLVYVGQLVYANPTQGKVFVKTQNGYELDELHNVKITAPADGQVLLYDAALAIWYNKTPNVPL